jgi:hypothetical protein
MALETGTLVHWVEPYADGIIKDAGTGIVLRTFSHNFHSKTITTYEIYRTKHKDKMRFEEYELEKIND